jgi:replication-associated recombination protein RarA
VVEQQHLPDELKDESFYHPGGHGFEKEVRKRLEWWAQRRGGGGS